MSVRAFLLGLLMALLIVALNLFNKLIWKIPGIDFASHLPTGVYALMLVVILGINPLLHLLRRNWRLRAGEIAVIAGMALASCNIAGVGFSTHVPQMLVMPLQLVQANEGWRRQHLMESVPPAMLVNDARTSDAGQIISDFIVGRGSADRVISLSDVPWSAWSTTLGFWLPIMALMGIAALAMAMIVHRQWSVNERLRYPLADFASSLFQQDADRPLGPIYRNQMFWIGLGGMTAILTLNYLVAWFPRIGIRIPMEFDFTAFTVRWPNLGKIYVEQFLPKPTIYPTAAAFAFLLATDVGLSLWSSHLVYGLAKLGLTTAGFAVSTNFLLGGWDSSTRFGGFMGTAAILLYTGRRYYRQVVRRAIGLSGGSETDRWTGLALWAVILPAAAVTGLLIGQGLDWTLAIGSVLMLLVMYVVVSRMSAEAGLYVIRAGWVPVSVFWGLMGGTALGVQDLFILGLVSMVLSLDSGEFLMPYVVNSLRVGDLLGVRPQRVGQAMSIAFIAILGVTVVLTLWAYYNYGAPSEEWTLSSLPRRPFDAPYKTATTLSLSNITQQVANYTPLERFAHITNDSTFRRFVGWTGFGLAAVLVLGMLRLRFIWWPIHPIFILVWGSWPMGVFAFSVLLGWLVKMGVNRIGGVQLYRKVKPMMIGIIAADMLMALVRMIVGVIYYQATGMRVG